MRPLTPPRGVPRLRAGVGFCACPLHAPKAIAPALRLFKCLDAFAVLLGLLYAPLLLECSQDGAIDLREHTRVASINLTGTEICSQVHQDVLDLDDFTAPRCLGFGSV